MFWKIFVTLMSGRSKLCNFINDSHKGNLFPLDFIQNKAKIHILNMKRKRTIFYCQSPFLSVSIQLQSVIQTHTKTNYRLKNSQFLTKLFIQVYIWIKLCRNCLCLRMMKNIPCLQLLHFLHQMCKSWDSFELDVWSCKPTRIACEKLGFNFSYQDIFGSIQFTTKDCSDIFFTQTTIKRVSAVIAPLATSHVEDNLNSKISYQKCAL